MPIERRPVVVFVDDEPHVLSSLRRLLRREPYELLTTVSPDQALAWLTDRDVSVMVSDQRMPSILGTELLQEVARRSPSTARVILTGHPGTTLRMQSLRQGVQGFLYKPWTEEVLKRTLVRLIHERELQEEGQEPSRAEPERS